MKACWLILLMLGTRVASAQTFDRDAALRSYAEAIPQHIDRVRSDLVAKVAVSTLGQAAVDKHIDAAGESIQSAVAAGRASARARALEDGEAASLADRVSAAIKTDIEDVEAGLQIAPLALFGSDSAANRAWTVTVAALVDDQFRIGTSYRRSFSKDRIGFSDLGFAECKIDWNARAKELRERSSDFADVCELVSNLFPIIGGFDVNFDPASADMDMESPRAELKRLDLQGEYRYSKRRVSLAVEPGIKMAREASGDDLEGAFSLSASLDVVAARLDGKPLLKGDQLDVKGGKLPPLLSFGVDLSATMPFDPSDQQERQLGRLAFDEFSLSVFADLRVSDTLAFRIGIPLQGEAETRKLDDKRGLVWTMPVFLSTVLKM